MPGVRPATGGSRGLQAPGSSSFANGLQARALFLRKMQRHWIKRSTCGGTERISLRRANESLCGDGLDAYVFREVMEQRKELFRRRCDGRERMKGPRLKPLLLEGALFRGLKAPAPSEAEGSFFLRLLSNCY
jgi:hypothetical protein